MLWICYTIVTIINLIKNPNNNLDVMGRNNADIGFTEKYMEKSLSQNNFKILKAVSMT